MIEYIHLVKGYEKQQQIQWEIARWQTWYQVLLSPNIKAQNKPSTPIKMHRFPWEPQETTETPEGVKVTREEAEILNEIFSHKKEK